MDIRNLRPSEGGEVPRFRVEVVKPAPIFLFGRHWTRCALHNQWRLHASQEEAIEAAQHPYEWCEGCALLLDAEERRQ